jgi:hypothetical protein
VVGKSKKGHRILVVTEYEWNIINEAMREYQEVCEWGESRSALKDIKAINNRLDKAVDEFEVLKAFTDLKKVGSQS